MSHLALLGRLVPALTVVAFSAGGALARPADLTCDRSAPALSKSADEACRNTAGAELEAAPAQKPAAPAKPADPGKGKKLSKVRPPAQPVSKEQLREDITNLLTGFLYEGEIETKQGLVATKKRFARVDFVGCAIELDLVEQRSTDNAQGSTVGVRSLDLSTLRGARAWKYNRSQPQEHFAALGTTVTYEWHDNAGTFEHPRLGPVYSTHRTSEGTLIDVNTEADAKRLSALLTQYGARCAAD